MTDQNAKMPEEIWAQPTDLYIVGVVDNFGSWTAKKIDSLEKYVRADLVEKMKEENNAHS